MGLEPAEASSTKCVALLPFPPTMNDADGDEDDEEYDEDDDDEVDEEDDE